MLAPPKPRSRPRPRVKLPDDGPTRYARAVVAGEIITSRFVRLACVRHLQDLKDGALRGLRYDPEKAERAIGFFRLLKHSKGKWAGEAFELELWQQFIVGSLFGWLAAYGQCNTCPELLRVRNLERPQVSCIKCDAKSRPKQVKWLRRFRTAYLEIARKNGKTTLLAGIGLLLAFFDGEAGAEVYAAATKRDQAKICWGEAARMVKATPSLRKRITVLVANLNDPGTNSKFEPLGADGDNLDGLNPAGGIVDELHAHKDRKVVDVLETGTGAREQPMMCYITTAGSNKHSVCWEYHEMGTKMLEGHVPDDSIFAFIATLDACDACRAEGRQAPKDGCKDCDDWRKSAVWIKANPNLGVSVKTEEIALQVEQAKSTPGQRNRVLRLRMNVWTETASLWLNLAKWDACADAAALEELEGAECYVGVDLSSTIDLTAIQTVFPDGNGEYDVHGRYFIPEENIEERVKRDRVPYDVWRDDGHIETTDGDMVDYDRIRVILNEIGAKYDVRVIVMERWNSRQLQAQLQGDGFEVIEISQAFAGLSAASKEFERLVAEGKIHHDGNPVLRWAASNVAIEEDAYGNIRPSKKASNERIDPITAIIFPLDHALRSEGEADPQIYEP